MALPRHIFAPAFRHQRLGWLFAALIGILVYVASFAMAAEATLSAITFTWDKGMETRMTVEIPAVNDESSVSQADRVRQVTSILRAMPEVTSVTPVADEETARLLKPWISSPELLKALPMPSLIDIERKAGSSLTANAVEDLLKNTISDTHVDDHAAWLADMSHLVTGLAAIAGLMIFLTGVTLIIAVNLMCRAIMATERDTLALLHSMGAEDDDIARNFQFHAYRLAGKAAWPGFAFALLSAGILLFFLRHFANPESLRLLHWIGLGAAVFLVPLVAIWIAAVSARLSTLKLLRAMP